MAIADDHCIYMSYVGIRVTDLEKSLKFCTELFGLKEAARWDARRRKTTVADLKRLIEDAELTSRTCNFLCSLFGLTFIAEFRCYW
jgi:catechol 2,3-dioxygenase-like lactoylglutathione lyase family enzyme